MDESFEELKRILAEKQERLQQMKKLLSDYLDEVVKKLAYCSSLDTGEHLREPISILHSVKMAESGVASIQQELSQVDFLVLKLSLEREQTFRISLLK